MNFEDTENILRDHFASLYHDLLKSLIVNDDKIMKKFTERTMHESLEQEEFGFNRRFRNLS